MAENTDKKDIEKSQKLASEMGEPVQVYCVATDCELNLFNSSVPEIRQAACNLKNLIILAGGFCNEYTKMEYYDKGGK
jgi:hypothetical protein